MENSHIQWTTHTFNPWIGCTKVSPGCAHCYAESGESTGGERTHAALVTLAGMVRKMSAGKEAAPAYLLPLDIALIRWSVMCRSWQDLAAGHQPELGPFLAGWFCRCIGASMPENQGQCRESFRVGWREADTQIEIQTREEKQ